MKHRPLSSALLGGLLAASGLLAGCSGGGGSSPQDGGFQLVSISVPEGSSWPINKRIVLTFNDEVALGTVIAGSTLQLKSVDGSGASAFYEVGYLVDFATGAVDRTRLVVQPFCPLEEDFSDAGLMPGGTQYQIFVPGQSGGSPFTIKSVKGSPLKLTQKRNFFTPASVNPAVVFEDTGLGPPAFLPEGTLVRLGDGTEIPFVFTGTSHELPAVLPLNLYSDVGTQVEIRVQLNQAVDPSSGNLNDDLVRIEYLDGSGAWQPFQTDVSLEANCTLSAPGAILLLRPTGILPQDTEVRIVLSEGFSDIVGQESTTPQIDFFAPTTTIDFQSLTPPDVGADEVFEPFNVSGEASFQDTGAVFDTPPAVWGGGALTAGFDFQGTGGPGGTFDWKTPPITINFSTDFQTIIGGPDGAPTTQVNVVGGVLDVNDLTIQAGTFLRVLATQNPLTIFATGDVTIAGTIQISGFDAKPIVTLFTPNQPEPGAAGAAGGGTGGTGSFLTSASTPQGGTGFGPFGIPNAGATGGELGYNTVVDKQQRRGGGGGGGRFGPDAGTAEGLAATEGDPGSGLGALSGGTAPPKGGVPNDGPFVDSSAENDFWGKRAVYDGGGTLVEIISGELAVPSAGYGGGAGGDSIHGTYPTIPFDQWIDKKGAGGGGAGGQLRIIALGRVIFKDGGRILCGGGDGSTGENVLGNDHIAGSSGGASGGHVIIESASQVDFSDGGAISGAQAFIQAIGGEGGIPQSAAVQISGGGNGGPGLIQLHVPDPNPATAIGIEETSAIRMPSGTDLGDLSDVTTPPAQVLIPTFGARSKARSIWIPLGAASIEPEGGEEPVLFAFDGTVEDELDPDAGKVVTDSGTVVPLSPILGPETLGTALPAPFVLGDGLTLVLSEPSLQPWITDAGQPSNDVYLRNPALLRSYVLRLESASAAKDFAIAGAIYSDAEVALAITADGSTGSLAAFLTAQGGAANVAYEIRPRFVHVQTGLLPGFIPDTGFVKVLFQAARATPQGLPDEENPVVDWTPDISEFNAVPAGEVDFFRWEVEFDLDATGAGLSTATVPISVDFLRVLFSF